MTTEEALHEERPKVSKRDEARELLIDMFFTATGRRPKGIERLVDLIVDAAKEELLRGNPYSMMLPPEKVKICQDRVNAIEGSDYV